MEAHNPRTLCNIVEEVLCYRGKEADPRWVDVDPGEHLLPPFAGPR